MMTVRTRFAPSPTGVLHLGSVRTALFSWLFARHHGGDFLLRIEDTDRARSTPENVEAIFDGMAWLKLDSDEKPVYQTERFDRYREVTEQWLKEGKAYRCYCTRDELDAMRERQMAAGGQVGYDGRCRHRHESREGVASVVRFRNPDEGSVTVSDAVRGTVAFENKQLDDLIIERSDGTPTYNFCVVIDDADMQITHVIRGDDHLNNTPRQVNMFAALGAELPSFAHLPMILGPDGAKLSKRHGAVDIRDYRDEGFLPEALLNYLVRLGWSYGDQEIFSIAEMIEFFDIDDVNQSASSFNPEKLRWLSQQHIKAMPAATLAGELCPYLERLGFDIENGPDPRDVADVYRDRADTLTGVAESARYCYEDFEDFDAKAAKKHLRPVILEPMQILAARLAGLEKWDADAIETAIEQTAADHEIKMGKLGQPVRVAVTGTGVSPPIHSTVFLVGRERTAQRLAKAVRLIEARATASH